MVFLRRLMLLVAVLGASTAGYAWWRRREESLDTGVPEWPPLPEPEPITESGTEPSGNEPSADSPTTAIADAQPVTSDVEDGAAENSISEDSATAESAASESDSAESDSAESAASESAASGSDSAESAAAESAASESAASGSDSAGSAAAGSIIAPAGVPEPAWIEPVEGVCPASHPVKLNESSGIFHLPGGRFYDRTNADRCYASAEAAVADGYRASKA